MKTTSEMIAVMQAYERGEEIESCFHDGRHLGVDPTPKWNWAVFDYRVKPKPIIREVTIGLFEYGDGMGMRTYSEFGRDLSDGYAGMLIARKTITITVGEGL